MLSSHVEQSHEITVTSESALHGFCVNNLLHHRILLCAGFFFFFVFK